MRHPVIGYLDVLNATTNQTIIDFYHERYVPNNQVFVVVGDVKTQQVLDEVAKQYAGTPRGRETYIPFEDEPRAAFAARGGARNGRRDLRPGVRLADGEAFEPRSVCAWTWRRTFSARAKARGWSSGCETSSRLVLGVSAVSDTPHDVAGLFAVMAVSRPETWQKASEEILREVYRLRDELVGPEELAKAKKQKAAELVFSRQSIKQMADSLGRNMLTTGDPLFDKAYVEGIQQVTAEQVRDVARRYFVPQRLNRVIIAPPGGAPKAGGKAGQSRRGQNPPGTAAERAAGAAETRRPPAAGEHSGDRARRVAGR